MIGGCGYHAAVTHSLHAHSVMYIRTYMCAIVFVLWSVVETLLLHSSLLPPSSLQVVPFHPAASSTSLQISLDQQEQVSMPFNFIQPGSLLVRTKGKVRDFLFKVPSCNPSLVRRGANMLHSKYGGFCPQRCTRISSPVLVFAYFVCRLRLCV